MLFINEIESMESLKRPRLKRLENAGTCDCLETFCMFMTRHTVKLPFVFLRCYCPRYHHENTLGSPKSWPRPSFFLEHWVWHICVHRKSSNCWSTFFFFTSSRVFSLEFGMPGGKGFSLVSLFWWIVVIWFQEFFYCRTFWSYLYRWWI